MCRRPVKPRSENASFPFCSERCRQIDLGKWLNEEHRVAGEPVDPESLAGGKELS
jgi:endogenous inhibitor of DNA gyrase (YacG/DUF329 family)